MNEGNSGDNVVNLNLPQIEEKSWWEKLTWHTTMQIYVVEIMIGMLPIAVFYYVRERLDRAVVIWMVLFILAVLLWALEYRKRLDTDHISERTS